MASDTVSKKCMTRDGKVRVANHHTGDILFPVVKVLEGGVRIPHPPLVLHAGVVTHVDADHWEELKKITVVQHYLDKGLIGEVTKDGAVSVTDATSTDLEACIPEHLQNEEQAGNVATASVVKTKVGEVKA